jgi:hypothetical protein
LMNIVIFCLLVFLAFICQNIFHTFPDLGSKFVFAYGIFTFFDWVLILIVDCIIGVSICRGLLSCSDFHRYGGSFFMILHWAFF